MAINFRAKSRKFLPPPTFIYQTGVPKQIGRSQRIFTGNDSSTLCINLVRFGHLNPEFTKLECVQQASMTYRVSFVFVSITVN